MELLNSLYETTKQLNSVLNQTINAQKRDSIIEEINKLIEKRGTIMEKIGPSFSEEEQKVGKKIVILNAQIEEKMESLFEDIKQDMRRVNKQKESNRTYINPYGKMTSTDGMYHDSKQ